VSGECVAFDGRNKVAVCIYAIKGLFCSHWAGVDWWGSATEIYEHGVGRHGGRWAWSSCELSRRSTVSSVVRKCA